MLVIGLTGGIGSGKTTVSNMFSRLGVPIIDTDVIARQLVKTGRPALDEIATYFGEDILNEDASLNRAKLAEITFNDEASRKQLERILHPRIRQTVEQQLDQVHAPYAIIVIPLLIESTGDYSYIDRILLVDCDRQTQINRVKQRDKRSLQQINQILEAQASDEQRQSAADDILENNADQATLWDKIETLHHKYLALAGSEKV